MDNIDIINPVECWHEWVPTDEAVSDDGKVEECSKCGCFRVIVCITGESDD